MLITSNLISVQHSTVSGYLCLYKGNGSSSRVVDRADHPNVYRSHWTKMLTSNNNFTSEAESGKIKASRKWFVVCKTLLELSTVDKSWRTSIDCLYKLKLASDSKQGQIGLERSVIDPWFRFTVPGGQGVGLQRLKGSRGRPTESKGDKG